MKFSISRETFQQAVNTAQRATATRVIQPILSNILIESPPDNGNLLVFSATDLDFSIQTQATATVLTPGRTTVSAKKLSEIISKLPSGVDVLFETDEATQTAQISCGKSVFDIRTLPADEFPAIKQIDADNYLTLNQKALMRAIQQTVFAAASYDANNVLGGVFFQLGSTQLEMAATDGSRLACRTETVANQSQHLIDAVSAIIPAKTLQECFKLLGTGTSEDTVRLAIKDGQIAFRTPSLYILSRLLDGQYPKYQQLIPADNKIVAYANKQALIASLERTAVMANERTNIVKMSFENGQLDLTTNTPDVGDSKDSLQVLYEGEPFHIAFNYKFVLDALKVIESDDVRMETNGALAPTLFRGKEEAEYLCLVMPVQVK